MRNEVSNQDRLRLEPMPSWSRRPDASAVHHVFSSETIGKGAQTARVDAIAMNFSHSG